MTPAERTAKIAELRAEADRLERGWPEKVEAMMVFQDRYGRAYITAYPAGDGRLVLVHLDGKSAGCMNGTKAGFEGFGADGEKAFTYLGHARDLLTIKTPAEEPTGAELVGKVCEFSDDYERWHLLGQAPENQKKWSTLSAIIPGEAPFRASDGSGWFYARLYREDRP